MSVFVDPLHNYRASSAPHCFRNKPSCHMYADTLEELHAMAKRIGLRRDWFQNSPHLQHYDLTPQKRMAAVRAGAIEHDFITAVKVWKALREERRAPK